jgi:hypothetical protein
VTLLTQLTGTPTRSSGKLLDLLAASQAHPAAVRWRSTCGAMVAAPNPDTEASGSSVGHQAGEPSHVTGKGQALTQTAPAARAACQLERP